MKIGIMQPYFFPYIGYFQLINLVDEFVIYDNIQYTKKGWINRNKIFNDGASRFMTLPLKKTSDYLNIIDREISPTWKNDRKKILNLIRSSYAKAPEFNNVYPAIENCLMYPDFNLFNFLLNSIKCINSLLAIDTEITISSSIKIDHNLKSQDKVISICKNLQADTYINSTGGTLLYDKREFLVQGINLKFIKSTDLINKLSIIDEIMLNPVDKVRQRLNLFSLL
tara:strand:+ start:1254 stop:1928 length:675 start_codon:yes stop_codon:yes gene_type:complete